MRRFIVGLLAVIGVVTLLGVLGSVGLVIWDRVSGPHVPEVTVLTLDVDGNLPDAPQTGGLLGLLAPHETSLRDVLGALDKLGLVPRFDQREQYKTALNLLTQTKMTDAEREQLQSLLGSLLDQIVAGVADGRKLAPDRVRDLVANGPYLAQDALSAHLVDHLGYVGDALDALKARAGAGAKAMRVARYLDSVGRPHDTGPVMALIYADGLMTRGKSDSGALFGTGVMGSDSVIHAFRLAERDKNVRAILFRIDSPGGSAVAAESIWDEVKKARAAGKPVIVSMGDVAGSGGYYIAASADKIVAEPATLTGSIGVVAGKVLIGGLMDKIGAGADAVQTSDNAALFSPLQDFTAEGYKQFEAALDSTYAGFKARVAEGRHMKPDQIESVAKGRIWTGAQAKANDLVDALGGYETAIALAKAEIGVPASGDITLRVYPRPESGLVVLLHRLLGTSREDPLAILPSIAGFMRELAMLSVRPGMLVMPPIEIR